MMTLRAMTMIWRNCSHLTIKALLSLPQKTIHKTIWFIYPKIFTTVWLEELAEGVSSAEGHWLHQSLTDRVIPLWKYQQSQLINQDIISFQSVSFSKHHHRMDTSFCLRLWIEDSQRPMPTMASSETVKKEKSPPSQPQPHSQPFTLKPCHSHRATGWEIQLPFLHQHHRFWRRREWGVGGLREELGLDDAEIGTIGFHHISISHCRSFIHWNNRLTAVFSADHFKSQFAFFLKETVWKRCPRLPSSRKATHPIVTPCG